jgi:hypothetical protein
MRCYSVRARPRRAGRHSPRRTQNRRVRLPCRRRHRESTSHFYYSTAGRIEFLWSRERMCVLFHSVCVRIFPTRAHSRTLKWNFYICAETRKMLLICMCFCTSLGRNCFVSIGYVCLQRASKCAMMRWFSHSAETGKCLLKVNKFWHRANRNFIYRESSFRIQSMISFLESRVVAVTTILMILYGIIALAIWMIPHYSWKEIQLTVTLSIVLPVCITNSKARYLTWCSALR